MDVISVISVMPNEPHETVGMTILLYRLSTCSRMTHACFDF